MGATVYWDERRSKWFVRVYDGGRQRKQYVGPDREDAEAVAEAINADLTRSHQEREDGRTRFRPGALINGEDALRWWFANYRFKRSTRDLNRGRIENHLIPHFCGSTSNASTWSAWSTTPSKPRERVATFGAVLFPSPPPRSEAPRGRAR